MYKSHINVNIKQSFQYIQYSIYLIILMYQSNISVTIKENSMLGFQNNGANITVYSFLSLKGDNLDDK